MHDPAPINLPWPAAISPDMEAAHTRLSTWAENRGLTPTPEERDRLESFRYMELTARAYPYARGQILDLAGQFMVWIFLHDDLSDTGDTEESQALSIRWTRLALGATKPETPLEKAGVDILREIRKGMSPAWQRRFTTHLVNSFATHVEEAGYRSRGFPPIQEYMAIRRITIGAEQSLDLMERFGGYELPPAIADDPALEFLRALTCDVLILSNDLVSMHKETANGDCHNLVLILENGGMSHNDAIRQVHDMIEGRVHAFRAHADLFLEPLTGTEHYWAATAFVEGMQTWMRANADWSAATARYTAPIPLQRTYV